MEAKLIINGVDFIPWCKRGGVQQSDVKRQSRTVTTLDGTLRQTETLKRSVRVELVELRDATLKRLAEALTSPATVEYTDKRLGDVTKLFYVSGPDATEKTIQGGNTYWSGVSFSLEER